MTVTIKYGKGYEETWAVFRGRVDEVREDLISYFGVDGESVANLTDNELVANVTAIAHGVGNVLATIPASRVVPSQPSGDEAQQPSTDVWANAEAAKDQTPPEEPAVNPLLAEIEGCADVGALKQLWAENRAVFDADADLMAVWKARGKSLSAK